MTAEQRGHQSVLRWHVVDNVPFQKSFEACIEKYYRNENAARSTPALPAGIWRPAATIPTAGAGRPSGTATT